MFLFFFSPHDFAIRSFIFSCFSFHSFLPVCTSNFIMLFFNFIMLVLVPFWCCCSFLSKLLFIPFSILLLFVPVQSYYLFLFNVTTILMFFFSLFSSTLHFQLHSALFQLHNVLFLFLFGVVVVHSWVQSYYLFLFNVATIHSSSALFLVLIRQYCCSL